MILKCRGCANSDLKSVVSLGFTPLANALLREDQLNEPEEKYPLDLVYCPSCTLVQIVETVSPEKLFSEYFYVSSISKTTLKNAKDISDRLIEKMNLGDYSRIIEIGSNDGYLLKNYKEKAMWVLGYEPAKNLSDSSNEKGITTFNLFFNQENAEKFASGSYADRRESSYTGQRFLVDVVHANNVLAHVAELQSIVEGIRTILKPDGVCVIETHYVQDLIESCQFDCVYHEHLCYYSATALSKIFEKYGMELVDVERTEMHGGTLRAFFQRKDGPKSFLTDGAQRVKDFIDRENQWVRNENYYKGIATQMISARYQMLNLLRELKDSGNKIVIYGASAKSTTFLNYFGIDSSLIDYVVDGTPIKQGRYTPGTHLKINAPSVIGETKPDYLLLLTWNFAKEIMEKEKAYREAGGKFIIPIPKLEVV